MSDDQRGTTVLPGNGQVVTIWAGFAFNQKFICHHCGSGGVEGQFDHVFGEGNWWGVATGSSNSGHQVREIRLRKNGPGEATVSWELD